MEQSVLQWAASVVSVEDKSADRRETCSAGSRGETECRTSVETRTCHACALRRRYGTALKGSSGVCLAMAKKSTLGLVARKIFDCVLSIVYQHLSWYSSAGDLVAVMELQLRSLCIERDRIKQSCTLC